MLPLTKQEQRVLVLVIVLLLTGLAVKVYRASHPKSAANPSSAPRPYATY